jgi:hypothetical protein
MPIDPERHWIHEPTVNFQFPINEVDDARIPEPNDYRLAAERLLRVLRAIDDIMIHSRDPARDWKQIALALWLPSCRYLHLNQTTIGRDHGVCRKAVSKSIAKLLRLAELKPNAHGFNGRL